jgi:hypothetical protein
MLSYSLILFRVCPRRFLLILTLDLLFSLLGRGVFSSGGNLRRLLGLGDVLDEEELEEELEEEFDDEGIRRPCWVSIS